MSNKYQPVKIERKWQRYWEAKKIYRARENSGKPKYYQLETFPYPSAAGLHVGHPKGYIAEDIHARYMRMKGKEVLYTMGWDAFGLPTENYAIKIGKSPQEIAKANVKNFKRQLKMFGFSYDWSREINTSEPKYYKWTQWLFLQLYKTGMAYQKSAKVNWCPQDQTVLANEQVVDGCCERCGEAVIQKEMKQWFFRITNYADRLLNDLEGLDPEKNEQVRFNEAGWPEETVKRQKDWIGRSEGALLKFPISNFQFPINVFTTRPDTLFGATYLVLAPEHSQITNLKLQITNWEEVEKYIEKSKRKTELQRKKEAGDPPLLRQGGATEGQGKTGVELKGVKAVNPANNEEIPIWIADYVLGSYGTGAIMAVPAHDRRDFEFTKKFNLPVKEVVQGGDVRKEAYEGEGGLVNSGKFSGLDSEKTKWEITKFVGGERQTQYKLRDWSVSRQRYWGVPIPIIYCKECGVVPVPEEDLPVKLPNLKDYRPKGMPPLASSDKWLKVKCPKCGGEASRDAETLDTFVDSSWYYLAYAMQGISNFQFPISNYKEAINYWMPVDLYVIGAEHVTAHLLYARFMTKFLYDQGYLAFEEPFLKLRHQGMILGPDGRRMSKRWGNVINPDDVISDYGADAVRLYEMFMGPFEDGQPWDTKGLVGTYRFLNRVWNFIGKLEEPAKPDEKAKKILNKYVKEIGNDIENFKFNTAVSGLMKLLNELEDKWLTAKQYGICLKLLAPFAPHIAEELWMNILGNKKSIHLESWPEYNEALLEEEAVTVAIQINGRLRDIVQVKKGLAESEIKDIVLERKKIKEHVKGKKVKKFIYVQDRLTNIVT